MAVVKRSISLDTELWGELSTEFGAGEISAAINEALDQYLRRRRALAAVAEFEAEHGAFTAEEIAQAEATLDAVGLRDLLA